MIRQVAEGRQANVSEKSWSKVEGVNGRERGREGGRQEERERVHTPAFLLLQHHRARAANSQLPKFQQDLSGTWHARANQTGRMLFSSWDSHPGTAACLSWLDLAGPRTSPGHPSLTMHHSSECQTYNFRRATCRPPSTKKSQWRH